MKRWVIMFSVIVVAGCESPQPVTEEDPIVVMLDTSREPFERRKAAKQAEKEFGNTARRISALYKIIWGARYPTLERTYAIDQLLMHDRKTFRGILKTRLLQIDDVGAFDHVLKQIAERKWTEFTPILVHSYARSRSFVKDTDRVERPAIEKLNPGQSVEQVIYETFIRSDERVSADQQAAAWELLNRLLDRAAVEKKLADAPGKNVLVYDIKLANEQLGVLPTDREGLLRLLHLRAPEQYRFWRAARVIVERLPKGKRAELQMRHLPALIQLDESTIGSTKEQLLKRVRGALKNAEHHLAPGRYDLRPESYPQGIDDWAAKLTWADLASLHVLLASLSSDLAVRNLFREADADLKDTETEYGGVIDRVDGKTIVKPYAPLIRGNDRIFHPSPAMIEHSYSALAHYHLHAQKEDNRGAAGPGIRDRRFADRMKATCLVFTFIDHDRLNVDYYQPGGVVIDLGTLRR